jgi:translation initiation factor IF-1
MLVVSHERRAAMQVSDREQQILARVLEMLGSGQASVADLEDYVIGYSVLGRIVALAQGEAETAEQERKLAWARAFSESKMSGKVSDKLAEMQAEIQVEDHRHREIRAREKLTNLRNTWQAVEQAMNAIKFLGRNGG